MSRRRNGARAVLAAAGLLGWGSAGAAESWAVPVMGAEDRTALVEAVRPCWHPDPWIFSSEVVLRVEFHLRPDGTVEGGVQPLGDNAPGHSVRQLARAAAAKAIIECQGDGFDLPPERYEEWKTAHLVFDGLEHEVR